MHYIIIGSSIAVPHVVRDIIGMRQFTTLIPYMHTLFPVSGALLNIIGVSLSGPHIHGIYICARFLYYYLWYDRFASDTWTLIPMSLAIWGSPTALYC